MHMQDPNGEMLGSQILEERVKRVSTRVPEWVSRLKPSRILGRLYREVTGKQRDDYISRTNRELLRLKVLTTPLSVHELFSITDIHVQDGQGISIPKLRSSMSAYELICSRTCRAFSRANPMPPVICRSAWI